MKKLMVFLLSSIFLFFLVVINLVSAIRINEIELNPKDECNDCTEWLEIYSEQEINLDGWRIIDISNKTLNLTGIINGYYILENFTLSLNNNDERLFLYNQTILIQETPMSSDSYNDNRTWQYCNGSWIFFNSTKRTENLCYSQNNTQQNFPQNQSQEDNNPTEEKIYLKLDRDEEDIVNGKKFEIEVKAFNLKNENYDIKIYIKPEDEGTVLSEVYDKKENKWLSGNYYINEIISGSGEKEERFSLRIKNKYNNFSGDAEIVTKIRKSGTSFVIDEEKEDAEVLKKEEKTYENNDTKSSEIKNNSVKEDTTSISSISGKVIQLGSRQAEKEELIYESKSEKIKKYSIYGLNLVLLIIILFLIMNKKVLKPEKQE